LEGQRKKIKRKGIIEKNIFNKLEVETRRGGDDKVYWFFSKFFNFLKYTFDFLGDHH